MTHTVPILDGSQLAEAIWPSSFSSGTAHLSLEQAVTLFDEFFLHYHPTCPLFLRRREPALTHRKDPLLFWTICGIAARRPPVSSLSLKTLEGVCYASIMDELKIMVANLMAEPLRTVGTVQALVLLCEWQVPATVRWEGRGWYYCGLDVPERQAVQIGLQIGLHRPHHTHEFKLPADERVGPESIGGQERTLAWIYCHIVGYNISCIQGLPPPVRDDYVTLEACTGGVDSSTAPPWLSNIPRQVFDTLRISRLTERFSQALGDSSLSPSGQLPSPSTTSLFSLFSSELTELERSVDTSDYCTLTRLHLCRIRMCAFELQAQRTPSNTAQRAMAATDCYVSCMRLAEAACSMPLEEVARLPVSVSFGHAIACICLIRLLSMEDGQALDMNTALTQISAVYRVTSQVTEREDEDELKRNFILLISFCVRHVHQDTTTAEAESLPCAESRMGLPNWLFDCILRAHYERMKYGEASLSTLESRALDDPTTNERPRSTTYVAFPLTPPPDIDYSMFTSSDFDEILASFSGGEWEVPSGDLFPTW
ncbi:hypothetical protein FIBSPDRAFT_1049507 [Athelia psychrophila]|uniref:Transcription factor domain-containing protein n=1 Tax=Athelia psychrophila TaxID=1759441 RepID=A0A166C407_9AGAM|nr:hypothetical protein FIBSPDRAFT_1049507 [Fibularhizoctonia sp. CBS 109695]